MIIYFSGTGNSRFVAERLAELTKDELCDVKSYTREGKGAVFTKPGNYVFVAPVYVSAPALVFLDFIRKSSFPDNVHAYFVMVCASYMGGSPAYCRKLASEKGFAYLGTAMVSMPQNYLIYWKTFGAEENREKIRQAQPAIERIAGCIQAGTELPAVEMKAWEYLSAEMILGMYYKFFMKADAFTPQRPVSAADAVRRSVRWQISSSRMGALYGARTVPTAWAASTSARSRPSNMERRPAASSAIPDRKSCRVSESSTQNSENPYKDTGHIFPVFDFEKLHFCWQNGQTEKSL